MPLLSSRASGRSHAGWSPYPDPRRASVRLAAPVAQSPSSPSPRSTRAARPAPPPPPPRAPPSPPTRARVSSKTYPRRVRSPTPVPSTRPGGTRVRLRSLGRRLRSRVAFPRAFRLRPASSSPPTRGTVLSNARATLNAHLESFPGGVSLAKAQQSTDDSLVNAARSSFTFAASTVALGGSIFAHQLSRGKDVDVASPRRAERGVERGVDSSRAGRTRGDAQDPRSTRGRVRDHTRKRLRVFDVAEGPKRHALRGAVHALIRSPRGLNRSG